MNRTQTHIAHKRTEGIDNMRYVLTVVNITPDEYNWHFIDCGLDFLRALFPKSPDQPEYEECYMFHLRKRFFWKWFRVQWLDYEQDYVNFLQEHHIIPSLETWMNCMAELTTNKDTLTDFDQYIKLLTR